MPPITLHVVPHTHWDREWYEPFEAYRFRLIKMADVLLDALEEDDGFRHFNFDGQTAAIEDYLEVRPDAEQRVRALVSAGRLAVGPWRILMDEFLCSPETIVRNLRQGTATARRLGRVQSLGYIPDSFGHIGQMPQLLRLAGFAEATVWRGVPRAVDRSVFRWVAPDGSWVRTAYLATSYSNAASLPETLDELLARGRRIADDLAAFEPGPVLLAMNGTDHRAPQPHLPALFAKANAAQEDLAFRIGSMEEYLAEAPRGEVTWHGEMRSSARANLLMGVLSARMPLKQAEFRASALLERAAEPLAALAATDTGALLERAWRWLVENSAHDSVCGCGIDAVAQQVHARYVQAARVAELIAADAATTLAARVDTTALGEEAEGVVVFNPSPVPRAEVLEVTLTPPVEPARMVVRGPDGAAHPVQLLEAEDRQVTIDMTMTAEQLARLVPTVHGRLLGEHYVNGVTVMPGRRATEVRLQMGSVPLGDLDVEAAKRTVEGAIAARPKGRFHVIGTAPGRARLLVRTPDVGALGWAVLAGSAGEAAAEPAVRADGALLDNGILRASVGADGRVSLLHVQTGTRYDGLLGIEDGGDAGDEYTWAPPETDLVVREPFEPALVEEVRSGPLEAALRVTARYRIPSGLATDERRRARRTTVLPVVATLALRAGEPFLRIGMEIHNDATDHRVRALFDLPFAATRSHADGAFQVVERGPTAEGAAHELGTPTFPCRRWVDASDGRAGLAVLHRGTPEYELAGGRALAITLLRCVGWLSRQGMTTRAGPAGPALATPGAQLLGTHRFELALFPHPGDWRAGGVPAIAERYAYPMRATVVRGHLGSLPPAGEALRIRPESVALSALTRVGDEVECRITNLSDEPVEAVLRTGPPLVAGRARMVGLLGDERRRCRVENGEVLVPLRAWEIATIRLGAAPA